MVLKLCECGCRRPVTLNKYRIVRFIKGHNARAARIKDSDRYAIDPVTGCWNWLLAKNDTGYGIETLEYVKYLAHRRFYQDKYGPIPDGLQLDHRCKNRGCVNPDHLEPVTNKVNSRRASKMKLEVLRQIRVLYQEGHSHRTIAKMLGVGRGAVYYIVNGLTWADVA